MLHLLKRHPWAVTAHFDWSLALVFAIPEAVAKGLLPPGLEPDLHDGLGFVAAAFVQTRRLRPTWAPRWMEQDFFLAGWRVFARGELADGRRVRGLKILGSDTDKWSMAILGGLMTHYGYRKVEAEVRREGESLAVKLHDRHGALLVDVSADLQAVDQPPAGSPFPDLRTARRFAGPMPFTFSHEPETDSLIVVEGARQHWEPRPVNVEVRRLAFFEREPFSRGGLPQLANAFWVEDVDYSWKRGMRVPVPA